MLKNGNSWCRHKIFNMKKRGTFLERNFLLIAFAILSFFSFSNSANADVNGICLSNINSKICQSVALIADCCGADDSAEGYDYCAASFREGISDPDTVSECSLGVGCCAEIQSGGN